MASRGQKSPTIAAGSTTRLAAPAPKPSANVRRNDPAKLPHWDADGPELRANLHAVSDLLRHEAFARLQPTRHMALIWHKRMMQGLDTEEPVFAGAFRGEPGLEYIGIEIAGIDGTHPSLVDHELGLFEAAIQAIAKTLDVRIPGKATPADVDVVIKFYAWAHSEWVRIHPFANGNGRTARLWANFLLMRYGLPPVLRLRPRPSGRAYEKAGTAAMGGDVAPMVALLKNLVNEAFARWSSPRAPAGAPGKKP